ncbi:GPI ethanolamine phosphate transferase 1 [Frankliniella fusca]|uniref:GPI ethanolamine phosphate transferase 1 n=1 Tax=Frankliniella fusca TaxID=407009 RepID=A0AAE1LNQ1_9NEOP|nr:GPI ethanolamine phosphate transferase 1 [Frankliniella fusca]
MGITSILLRGFLVHLVFLSSMFDIYFKTPIVPGIKSNPNPVPGPAKRVVFIVADGLRADSFFSNDMKSTPFLRSKLETDGSWGVSHTRVPTESRPGVVALAAGIYEDPSAVFKGWKENPVEFDSVFNQSHRTWAWGSPDIVHMFTQDNVETMAYSPDDEDFSGKDSSWKLDEWVFDNVKVFLKSAETNPELSYLLHHEKNIFFLHLLGLDTAGHTIKPQSLKYQTNLEVVDKGVKEMEELFENFFPDKKTAYVFTADHGMTNWGKIFLSNSYPPQLLSAHHNAPNLFTQHLNLGSHGAGSQDETEVPLLAWGAGVRKAILLGLSDVPGPTHWSPKHIKRHDVKQADIVVLISVLIGCNIPVNSLGHLPRNYLDLPTRNIAELSFLNAEQLLAQAERKRELVQVGTILFQPYWKLKPKEVQERLAQIKKHLSAQEFYKVMSLSDELSSLSIAALQYYHNYYQGILLTFVSLSFIGWIAWLFCELRNFKFNPSCKNAHIAFGIAAVIVFILIQGQGLKWQFNIYLLLPIALWWEVFCKLQSWIAVLKRKSIFNFLLTCLILVLLTEILVAAFFQRWILSLGMLVCSLWPFGGRDKLKFVPASVWALWLFSCVCVAVFPLLPVIGSESSLALVLLSAFLWHAILIIAIYLLNEHVSITKVMNELAPLAVSILVNFLVTKSMDAGHGLPRSLQFLAWTLLLSPLLIYANVSKTIPKRLVKLHATLIAPYILMSVRHEALFLLALCFHLNCWLLLEAKLGGYSISQLKLLKFPPPKLEENYQRHLYREDFRRAGLFVFYVFLSFFGTGNIASLNSFEVTWVRCFLSVFSPFTMMTLILLKVLIPFVIVSSIFRAINITVQAPTGSMFVAVLILCDMMGLQFLHLVTNEGSWLDIGTSISHFVIVQVTVLALVLLYGIASVLTGSSLAPMSKDLPTRP